jgi:hypothetical protein
MKGTVRGFLGHVVPQVIRPLHALWNEVIGFIFLALAAIVVPSLVRNVRALDSDSAAFGRLLLAATWVLVMGFFGITSFRKARKISRS